MPEQQTAERYERRDVDGRHVLRFFLVFFLALAAAVVALIWLFDLFKLIYNPVGQFYEASQVPPPPRLEAQPAAEMERFRQQEEQILNTYGWVDEASGVTRIPIDRAMELLLKQGLPVRRGGAGPTAPPYAGAPTTPAGQAGLPPPRELVPPGAPREAPFTGPQLTQPAGGGRVPPQPGRVRPPGPGSPQP